MRFATNEFESSVSEFRQLLLPEPQGENAPVVTVVLDYTALMALVCAQAASPLENTLKFVAPVSLKAYVERLQRETRNIRGEGTSSYEGGQRGYHPMTEVGQGERIDSLEKVLAFLENHVELITPQSAAPAGVNVKRLRRILGDTTTDSILLACEQKLPLYCDDAVLVRGLKGVLFLELQAAPSQIWLALAETTGKITQVTYRESIDRLNIWNYRFTHLEAEFFLWLLDRDAWKVTGSVQAAFRQLHGPLCHPQAAVGISARVLKKCYLSTTSSISKLQRSVILSLCLKTLESGRENSDLIRRVERQLSGVGEMGLGMAPIQLADLLQDIEAWKKANWRF